MHTEDIDPRQIQRTPTPRETISGVAGENSSERRRAIFKVQFFFPILNVEVCRVILILLTYHR